MVTKYVISPRALPDQKVSTILGISPGVVTAIFILFTLGLESAKINFFALFGGEMLVEGDLSILRLVFFIVCALVLISVQHYFTEDDDKETDNII